MAKKVEEMKAGAEAARKAGAAAGPFKPRIAAFLCRACAGAELMEAVESELAGKCVVDVIPVVCSGQLRTGFMLAALEGGADAAVLFACRTERCRYGTGSRNSSARIDKAKRLLASIGVSPERIARFESSPMESANLRPLLAGFAARISAMGGMKRAFEGGGPETGRKTL